TRTALANASTVGRSAGVANPENVPTYLTRLHNLGLVEFAAPDDSIAMQFDILAADPMVQAAEASVEARGLGTPRLVRKAVVMAQLGSQCWAASDPTTRSIHPAAG